MEKRIEVLDSQKKPIAVHIACTTVVGALFGFTIGAAIGQAKRCTILGAGIGSGYAFQESNEYLKKLKYDVAPETTKSTDHAEEPFVRRLTALKYKYF